MPDGEDLGALVDALEAFLGFGNGLDGETQNSSTSGACNETRTRCHPSSMRRMGPGMEPLKRRFCFAEGVSKKRSGLGGREEIDDRFDADGNGFSRTSLNFNVISQAASKASGRG